MSFDRMHSSDPCNILILIIQKQLSFIFIISTAVMNSNNVINHKDRTKAKVAIHMAGAIATTALLLLGLSFISSNYQPAIAQQQGMTTGGGDGGGTTTNSGSQGGATGGATPQGGNTTAGVGAGEGGNDSLSEIRMHIEAVRTALQNNDTQGAMLHLELADNALGGAGVLEVSNMTAIGTTAAGNATNTTTTGGGNATGMTTGGTTGGNATTGGEILGGIF